MLTQYHDNHQEYRFYVQRQSGGHADGLNQRIHAGYLQEARPLCQSQPEKGRDGTAYRARDSRQSPCRVVQPEQKRTAISRRVRDGRSEPIHYQEDAQDAIQIAKVFPYTDFRGL